MDEPKFLYDNILSAYSNELTASKISATQIDQDAGVSVAADSFGICFPDRSGSLEIQTSVDGMSYVTVAGFSFQQKKTLYSFFDSTSSQYWRIVFDAATTFSVIKLGESFELSERNYGSVGPPALNQKSYLMDDELFSGQWIGRRSFFRRTSVNYNARHTLLSEVRTNIFELIEHLRFGGGTFYAWRPDTFPQDVIYGYSLSEIGISTGSINYGDFKITIDGIGERA